MVIVARIFGAFVVVLGVVFLVSPSSMKGYIAFWKKDLRIYWLGVLRLVLGSIFLMAAPTCRMPAIMNVLGILLLVGGVLIFGMGPKRVAAMLEWFDKQSEMVIRLWALIAFGIGYIIVHAAQF
ncbi:MAG: hypothetical protein JSW17_00385 [Candidatus Omnitrophota bacterium]|nr:MAG: hypothetical protein JSW17_00385 [Candidatus Omnitrophota bacterium]